MEYQALYRKYRPQTFEDVIGQTHVTSTLAREVAEGHVAHAYLFAGPRGTGKTTTARILAKALNCENRQPDGSPDNTCNSCLAVTEGSSLDVMELDAASHNSVDDIREMRVSVTTVASTSGAKRVFILDEAHMLSKAAGNALLKTLEEPPEGVHFVLATTEPYKLLDTIRSRSQRFDFHAISIEALTAHLMRISELESFKADSTALMTVARHALGSARDSLSLLEQVAALGNGVIDQVGVSQALGLADSDAFNTLVAAIANQDARSALELVARLASEGADLRRFVAESVGFLRGVFLAHYAPNLAEIADEPAEVLNSWMQAASTLSATEVLRGVDILGDALIRLREGREERLMLELSMIRLTRPEASFDPAALQIRVDRLERRMAAQPVGAASSPESVARSVEPADGEIPGGEPADPASESPRLHIVSDSKPVSDGVVAESSELERPASEIPSPGEPTELVDEDERIADAVAFADSGPLVRDDDVAEDRAEIAPTMAQFEAIWPALFAGLRDLLGSRSWALFRETEPGAVEGSTLVVSVRHDFHLMAIRKTDTVAKIVATRAGDLLGGSVRVVFRAADQAGVASPPKQEGSAPRSNEDDLDSVEFAPENLLDTAADPTDPFKLVADELGATVIEEYEVDDD